MPSIRTDLTADYLESVEPPADDLVEEMEAHAEADGIPIAARSIAHLQAILARAMDAGRALEFGTAIGYSTLHVARTGTDVVTTEVDPDRIEAAVDYLERDGIDVVLTDEPENVGSVASGDGEVTIVVGPALETLPGLSGPFDLAFLDAVKEEYAAYLEGCLPLLPTGGVVVADNLLRHGRVAAADRGGPEVADDSVVSLLEFNEAFVGHDLLDAIVTPQGDGTGIGVKLG